MILGALLLPMLLLLLLPFFNAWSIGDVITSRRTSSEDDDIGVVE